jgi:hypothetical protein
MRNYSAISRSPLPILVVCLALVFFPQIAVALFAIYILSLIPFWVVMLSALLLVVYCVYKLYDMLYIQEMKWERAYKHIGKPVIVNMSYGEEEGILLAVDRNDVFCYSVQIEGSVFLFSCVNYKEE